ncbi:MAG TPA: peptidase S8, partial [Paenibacillus sp.]|nr:peptidase S8 [Paenibacillus sp.]
MYLTNDTITKNAEGTVTPNDMLFSTYQWNLPAIETELGWNLSKGSKEVIVAVVDTGVQINHPDLKGKLLTGYNAITNASTPEDDVGHGTHVSGIIGALVNNGEGVAG